MKTTFLLLVETWDFRTKSKEDSDFFSHPNHGVRCFKNCFFHSLSFPHHQTFYRFCFCVPFTFTIFIFSFFSHSPFSISRCAKLFSPLFVPYWLTFFIHFFPLVFPHRNWSSDEMEKHEIESFVQCFSAWDSVKSHRSLNSLKLSHNLFTAITAFPMGAKRHMNLIRQFVWWEN